LKKDTVLISVSLFKNILYWFRVFLGEVENDGIQWEKVDLVTVEFNCFRFSRSITKTAIKKKKTNDSLSN